VQNDIISINDRSADFTQGDPLAVVPVSMIN
jgi:hypothetical protein